MITGPIDDSLDGAANQAVVEAIRAAVASNNDGGQPFLLLPVRLETRFMKADVPATGALPTVSSLTAQITQLGTTLAAVASRPLTTQLGGVPRRNVRATEIANYQFLDQTLLGLLPARDNLANLIRDATGTTADLTPLASASTTLLAQTSAALET